MTRVCARLYVRARCSRVFHDKFWALHNYNELSSLDALYSKNVCGSSYA